MSETIYQRIAELAEPVLPPPPWNFLRPVHGMRQRSIATAQLTATLRQEFTEAQLEESRVLVRRQNGELELSPVLIGDTWRGLFLRHNREDEVPFDIVNEVGALAAADPPAFEASRDYYTRSWSGEAKVILVAFSDDDLAVLRMLSLPCTPAAGLAEINGQQVRSLFRNPLSIGGGPSTQDQVAAVARGKYELVLVSWHLAELSHEEPEGLDAAVSRLVKAADAFRVDVSERVSVWQPMPSEYGRISSGVDFGDPNLIREVIWQSANYSRCDVKSYVKKSSTGNPINYADARRELLRTIDRARELGFQSSEVTERLEAFHRSFGKDVVDGIIRDAMLAVNSVDRSLLLAAAELMGHWHNSSTLVRSIQEGAVGRLNPCEVALKAEKLRERLRVVDSLVKIHRELARGK